MTDGYQLVQLANGAWSLRSLAEAETFHPVIGPTAEAEALFVRQTNLVQRVRGQSSEFVVWDVGLGAAANALAVLRATREIPCPLRLVSFDRSLEPLRFALNHAAELGYFSAYEGTVRRLMAEQQLELAEPVRTVHWELHLGDFPSLIGQSEAAVPGEMGDGSVIDKQRSAFNVHRSPFNIQRSTHDAPPPNGDAIPPIKNQKPKTKNSPPHLIMWDPYSPARNPGMWTQPLFAAVYRRLAPERPCVWATYSRSTMLRVALLLAGFFVGRGQATGEKEETTIAANHLALLPNPLDRTWLARTRRSASAEPLWTPAYRQARLAPATLELLGQHPQFREL